MKKKNCIICKYCVGNDIVGYLCKFNPPVMSGYFAETVRFPLVNENMFCFQFKKKKEKINE